MKNKLLAILLMRALLPTLAWPQIPLGYSGVPTVASFGLISSTSAACPSGCPGSYTTSPIDTRCMGTGCTTSIIVAIAFYMSTPTFTDSAGNSWTPLTAYGMSSGIQFFYCSPCTSSMNHTVTHNGSGQYTAIAVAAFQGLVASPFDGQNGATAMATTVQTGTGIVTTQPGDLVVTAVGELSTMADSVNSGFTKIEQKFYSVGNNYGIALAWQKQTTAGAINPTWTADPMTAQISAAIVAFKTTGGGGGGGLTLVSSNSAASPDGSTAPSVTLSTTGSNLVIAFVSFLTDTGFGVQNGASQPLTQCTSHGGDGTNPGVKCFYIYNPTPSGTDTFTLTGSIPSYSAMTVTAWSNSVASPLDNQNGVANVSGTTTTGAVSWTLATPPGSELIISSLTNSEGNNPLGGFTIIQYQAFTAGQNFAITTAYLLQTSSGSVNPTWTSSTGGSAAIAAFK